MGRRRKVRRKWENEEKVQGNGKKKERKNEMGRRKGRRKLEKEGKVQGNGRRRKIKRKWKKE